MATRTKKRSNPVLAVGNEVLIRTVTHYHIGRIVDISDGFVTLEDACWVADTGRFSTALLTGSISECEAFPDPVTVSLGAICDATLWRHPIPMKTK